jgi:hypothetical protein
MVAVCGAQPASCERPFITLARCGSMHVRRANDHAPARFAAHVDRSDRSRAPSPTPRSTASIVRRASIVVRDYAHDGTALHSQAVAARCQCKAPLQLCELLSRADVIANYAVYTIEKSVQSHSADARCDLSVSARSLREQRLFSACTSPQKRQNSLRVVAGRTSAAMLAGSVNLKVHV